MARSMQDMAHQPANLEMIAFGKKLVKLRSVALELCAFVKNLAKGLLHHGYAITNANLSAQVLLNVGGR